MARLLVAQSGGPTAAINATVAGVIQAAWTYDRNLQILGAVNGIQGVFEEHFIDINEKIRNAADLALLCHTPSAALGSCRLKIKKREQLEQIVSILRKHEIKYFIYIGGNDSMDTVYQLSKYCEEQGIKDLFVMGAPKTIDNDLIGTDHCPGFGSAAKYIATSVAEVERDAFAYTVQAVTIIEIMGRNAGWLTAASALARINGGAGPDLIYLCEVPFEIEEFLSQIRMIHKRKPNVIVAISEGIKDRDGKYISEYGAAQGMPVDSFGHAAIAGSAKYLENVVKEQIGCKVRSLELSLLQRCAAHIASGNDISESRMLGMKACQCALDGMSGRMASLTRTCNDPYSVAYDTVDLSQVANLEKKVPLEWITADGHDVTQEMIDYLLPLIQGVTPIQYENGVPKHIVLY